MFVSPTNSQTYWNRFVRPAMVCACGRLGSDRLGRSEGPLAIISGVLRPFLATGILAAGACLAVFALVDSVGAQVLMKELPKDEQGITVDENPGAQLTLDLDFVDDHGDYRQLFDFFDGKKPVLLSLNYSDCPMLCSTQLANLTNTLKDMSFQPGRDFEIVSISLNPQESVARAKETKEKYVALYNIPESADGWHFLVGKKANIQNVADTIGFRFRRLDDGHFVHPPLFVLCSPGGKVVRYVHGLQVESGLLESALIESAEGKIGSPINRFMFACFQYNDKMGQYTPNALFLMKVGGGATAVLLLATLVPYWVTRKNPAGTQQKRDEDQLIDLTQ